MGKQVVSSGSGQNDLRALLSRKYSPKFQLDLSVKEAFPFFPNASQLIVIPLGVFEKTKNESLSAIAAISRENVTPFSERYIRRPTLFAPDDFSSLFHCCLWYSLFDLFRDGQSLHVHVRLQLVQVVDVLDLAAELDAERQIVVVVVVMSLDAAEGAAEE